MEEPTDYFGSLVANWGLVPTTAIDLNSVLEALTQRVAEMLLGDRRGLLNALYRLDVNEFKVTQTFKTVPPAEQPRRLAELILERELQKAKTRRQSFSE